MHNNFKISIFAIAIIIAAIFSSCKKKEKVDPKDPDSQEVSGDGTKPDDGIKGGSKEEDIKASFASSTLEIAEEKTSETTLKVTFSKELTKDASVSIQVAGTAKSGTDYTTTPEVKDGKITLSVAKGAKEASIAIKPINNEKIEDNKTMELTLVASDAIKLGNEKKATVTITNDDKEPEVIYAKISDLKTKTEISEETKIRAKVIAKTLENNKRDYLINDGTAGIVLSLIFELDESNYKIGQEIEVTLSKGIKISEGSVINRVNNKYSKKVASSITITPKKVTIDEVLNHSKDGELVEISDVFFKEANEGKTFGESYTISTCSTGKEIDFYTNNADLKKSKMPKGKSTIIGVSYKYGNQTRLFINQLSDISATGTICTVDVKTVSTFPYTEGFEDGLGDFYQYSKLGWSRWGVYSTARTGKNAAYMYGLLSNRALFGILKGEKSEDWLVSPAINLKGKTEATVNFFTKVDGGYLGSGLKIKISTDYKAGDPAKATWKILENAKVQHYVNGRKNDYTSSGNVSLANYLVDGVRIAFVYTSTDRTGYRWRMDDFKVEAK